MLELGTNGKVTAEYVYPLWLPEKSGTPVTVVYLLVSLTPH